MAKSSVVTKSGTSATGTSKGSTRISFAALFVSFFAVIVSVASFQREPARDSDKATMDVIRQTYADFMAVGTLRAHNPLHSHLFEVADSYRESVKQVKVSVGVDARNSSRLARLVLEERAIADNLFTLFEQAYFQSEQAKTSGDAARSKFLSIELDYFTDRLLRNPRLLWLWANDGGKLCLHYETAVQNYYEQKVQPKSQERDGIGPFAADIRATERATK